MIELSSNFTQMVKDSEDYKVVLKGGKLYIIPSNVVDTIDWTRHLTIDYASALTINENGEVIKSRYTKIPDTEVRW